MAKRRYCRISLLMLVALAVGGPTARGAEAPKPPVSAMLYLTDGDFFSGTIEDSNGPDVISWQSGGAVQPFQFPMAAIRAAFFPSPEHPKPAEADYCFELSDGDLLFGSLIGLTPDVVEIESQRFGQLHVQRSHIRRIVPWQGAAAWNYSGPNNLAEWRHLPEKDGWLEEAGHLLTQTPSASLCKQINLPPQAAIKLAISWNMKLDFLFVIAAGEGKKHENEGVHLEVWDQTLVLVRESRDDADLATIIDLKKVKNRLHLQFLVDQKKGKVAVHSLDGTKLGEIEVDIGAGQPLNWIFLRNHRGDVRFEQLVVSKWSGQSPPKIDVNRQHIQQTDGSIVYGDVLRYEADKRQFIVEDGTAEKAVAAQDVASVVLSTEIKPTDGSVRVGCHDGNRLSGQLTKVQAGQLHITRPGIEETMIVPVAEVRCLIGASNQSNESPNQPSVGRLELEGVRSHGMLVDGKSDEASSCLVWKPRLSETGSPLFHDVSGRIVYRDPPPPVKTTPQPQVQNRRALQRPGIWGAVVQAFSGPPQNVPAAPRLSGYPHAIFLLAGDRIPCIISRIDDRGVYFSSSVVESDMIPHEQIKAVELVPRTAVSTLAEEKQMRLLTLPRMQKNNPPTHLIASTSGDYLRARMQSMDAQTLVAETRLESKRLPRGRVATIIWLHPVTEEKPPPAEDAAPLGPVRVQAVRADGVRLTFVPHEFASNSLIGHSELLGACKVEVKAVDRILLGNMIEASSDETLYDAWRLSDAIEPKYVSDDASSAPSTPALNSALIGKPAPEVKLDLLDGGKFRLSEEKGHIVVLDFWATWCAPCMQALPEMDRVIHEFQDEKVKYVAVNMQEDRATISAALERLKLDPAVALDIDGAASERYEVSAIPQVVVIDAAGNVARMFIGVDVNFADQLRETLKQMVAPPEPLPADDTAGQ
ncbi:MAG: TlpA family protein disulfide reductase [Planctomycetes bacterium]|nr:TlpA family protein disulfide reductase [Planctomycetota bacterium]